MRACIAALVLMGCGQEYGLSSIVGVSGDPSAAPVREVELDDPAPAVARPERATPEVWTAVPSHGGSTVEVKQLEGSPVRVETHRFGGDAPTLTDVLFVVDGSTSMRSLVAAVQDGMAALGDDGVFPANTRIAVTNMTPRSPRTPDEVHRTVKRKQVMRLEPGFGGLVDAGRLRDARETLAAIDDLYLDRLGAEGCDRWFAPTERGPDGVSCLVAHTQILEAASEVEAGLLSVGLVALSDPELFRPGAAVNLVFVSDTHDPGLPPDHRYYDTMVQQRPDPAKLAEGIAKRFPVASVRMHAIAPAEPCTFETFDEAVYFDAADVTGGLTLDICEATPDDYVSMMRQIAVEGSRPTRPVLALGTEADAVDSVTVDGIEVPYQVQGRALVLDGTVPARAADVKVRYRTLPASMPRTRSR